MNQHLELVVFLGCETLLAQQELTALGSYTLCVFLDYVAHQKAEEYEIDGSYWEMLEGSWFSD